MLVQALGQRVHVFDSAHRLLRAEALPLLPPVGK
jgi:hypothetical protein